MLRSKWGANLYLCKKKKKNHWKHHRFQWIFIEIEVSKAVSPLVLVEVPCSSTAELNLRSWAPIKALRLISQASLSKAMCRFTPNIRRLETTGCPRNHLWACVCCVCGVFCERCSVWVRGKVFVSPSPGPSVCCGSVGCVRCCGSSNGHKQDPGPERRGPHLLRLLDHKREVTVGTPTLQKRDKETCV